MSASGKRQRKSEKDLGGRWFYYVLLAGATFLFKSVGSIRHKGAFATVPLANVGSWISRRTYWYVPPDISCYLLSHSTMPPQTQICFLLSCIAFRVKPSFLYFAYNGVLWDSTVSRPYKSHHLAMLTLIGWQGRMARKKTVKDWILSITIVKQSFVRKSDFT